MSGLRLNSKGRQSISFLQVSILHKLLSRDRFIDDGLFLSFHFSMPTLYPVEVLRVLFAHVSALASNARVVLAAKVALYPLPCLR